ncbi:MAG: F-type H+-transporting ATPase subunit delta [Acidobacteriaceae bacterium]|jgi:F-type H+-transporting ATPase subunit delta
MATVTNTYARAFADVVFNSHLDPAKTLEEVQSIAGLVAESKELRQVWETPSISAEQKRGVLDAIVKRDGISKPVRNFLAVLIDHHRINFLRPIVDEFSKELDQRLGFVQAEITSSRSLDDSEKNALESKVQKLTGKKVRAKYSQNPSLLGGAIIRVGSTIYDGSVEGQLEVIREQLAAS